MSLGSRFRFAWMGLVLALLVSGSATAQEGAQAPTPPAATGAASAGTAEDECTPKCDDCVEDGGIRVAHTAPLLIDDASNASTGSLELRNNGKKTARGLLCAGDFQSVLPERPLAVRVTLGDGKVGDKACLQLELGCGVRKSVTVSVEGAWAAGKAIAALTLDGKPLLLEGSPKPAQLSARKRHVPFNVKVAAPGDAAHPIEVIQGEPLFLVLRNEDEEPLDYTIRWRLLANEAQIAPVNHQGNPVEPKAVSLSRGSHPLAIPIPQELFPSWLPGLFRTRAVEARLIVEYVDATNGLTSAPSRTLPVWLSLARHSGLTRTFWSSLSCLALLLVGGLASLVLNHGVPNGYRKVAIRSKLEPLAGLTKRLSTHVSGALRIELRVQRTRLRRRIDKEPSYFPAANEVYEEAAREVDVLSQRIVLVSALDERLRRIERMGASGPPALLHVQKKRLAAALRALGSAKPEPAIFSSTDALLREADAELARLEQEDPGPRQLLLEEAEAFWKDQFWPMWQGLASKPAAWARPLTESMGAFVNHAQSCFEQHHAADETLATLDTAFAKLKLIAQYVRVCDSATPEKQELFGDTAAVDRELNVLEPVSQRERFFEALSGAGARTLEEARLLLREAEQGIFVQQLVDQIKDGKFMVYAQPQSVEPYDPVTFSFVFYEDKFNEAAAKEKLDCVWTFKEGSGETRTEDCWEPVQFFTTTGEKEVWVEVRNGPRACWQGKEAKGTRLLFQVHAAGGRWLSGRAGIEALQLALVLAVTVGALLTGAREKLQGLDLFEAIAAIVALGFGADTLKNLVTRRPANGSATTAASTTPPAPTSPPAAPPGAAPSTNPAPPIV